MDGIILARVSSKDQEDNFSTPAQVRISHEYALKKGIKVIEVIELVESATKKRKEFNKIYDIIKSRKDPVAIIVHKVDRLQRSYSETVKLEDFRISGKVELHFFGDNLIINRNSTSRDLMMWDVLVMFARAYVTALTENVKRGNAEARQQQIVFNPPSGYKLKDGEMTLDDTAPLIKQAFQLYSSGLYSLRTLADELEKRGYKPKKAKTLTIQTISQILNNPFYYGVAKSSFGNYAHKYEAIISKELFDKCQNVLNGKVKTKHKVKNVAPAVFRGVLTCECGRSINPDFKKGRYVYYRCINRKCRHYQHYVKEEVLLKHVNQFLRDLVFPDDSISIIVERLKKEIASDNANNIRRSYELQTEYNKNQERLDNLLNMRLDGELTPEEYAAQKSKIVDRQFQLSEDLKRITEEKEVAHVRALKIFRFAQLLPEIFLSSNTEEKNKILKYVVSNSTLSGELLDLNAANGFEAFYKKQDRQHWHTINYTFRTINWSLVPEFQLSVV